MRRRPIAGEELAALYRFLSAYAVDFAFINISGPLPESFVGNQKVDMKISVYLRLARIISTGIVESLHLETTFLDNCVQFYCILTVFSSDTRSHI